MVRSLIIISLAIVCGAAAAIGVNQALRRQPAAAQTPEVPKLNVIVATRPIPRGTKVTADMVQEQQWPAEFNASGVVRSMNLAVDRIALVGIMTGEPLFEGRLTKSGAGFIASIIEPGKRAYTIQTRGPSASVAGFVRPQDRVDVLVSLRGRAGDETGGSSTTTLLQSVEILAIDQILDPDLDAVQKLEMWTRGDEVTSVTLQVDPAEASLLALGQSYGELSLSLRGFGDDGDVEDLLPATVRDIEALELFLSRSGQPADSGAAGDQPREETPRLAGESLPVTSIWTLRGSATGRVDLVR